MYTFASIHGTRIYDDLLRRVRQADQARQGRLAKIKTRADAEEYIEEVQKKIQTLFNLESEKPTCLPEVIGTIDLGDILIDRVVFYSQGNFPITGLFYYPKEIKNKLPAVVEFMGHSPNGKFYKDSQIIPQSLVKIGYVVLAFDFIGQGERRQFLDLPDNQYSQQAWNNYGCCSEHNLIGKAMYLSGDWSGSMFVRDSRAAVDYLISRAEVDAKRIGVTGCSGGGNLSVYAPALDPRIQFTAPSCWVSTYLANVENELVGDIEQCPPGVLAKGLDIADFLIAIAPKPVMIMDHTGDFFDLRAVKRAYREIHKIYQLLGKGGNVQLVIDDRRHEYSPLHRQSMYKFFSQHARVELAKDFVETAKPLPEKSLWVAPQGQALNLMGSCRFNELYKNIIIPKPTQIKETVKKFFKLKTISKLPHYRRLRGEDFGNKQVYYSRRAVQTEPSGMEAIIKYRDNAVHEQFLGGKTAMVYIPNDNILDELTDFAYPDINARVYGLEVRGLGENRPLCVHTHPEDLRDEFCSAEYFMASQEEMLGNSYLGRQIHDALVALKLIKAEGKHQHIHLIGRGRSSIIAAIAGLLSDDVDQVTLYNALPSWRLILDKPISRWSYASLPYGVLKHFDLTHIYTALKDKQLKIIKPWDQEMRVKYD